MTFRRGSGFPDPADSSVFRLSQPEETARTDRREARTNLLIIATLYFERSSYPVRIRDLSPTGARIEGAGLPIMGSPVTLRRGKLEAKGAAVWKDADRAGLSFSQPIDVTRWLPAKSGTNIGNAEEFVFELKHAPRSISRGATSDAIIQEPRSDDLRHEIDLVRRGLIELGERLANDIILVATHPEIQFLDEAVQRLVKIERTILGALEAGPGDWKGATHLGKVGQS